VALPESLLACPGVALMWGSAFIHVFSQWQDCPWLKFERYTLGYVEQLPHDGREMLREARQLRSQLLQDRKHFRG